MPYNADLRCSYIKVNFNMSWFYHMVEQHHNMEIDFLPSTRTTGTREERCDFSVKLFEQYIEEEAEKYIVHKAFFKGQHCQLFDYNNYDNIWDFLYECAQTYPNPSEIKISEIKEDDEDEDEVKNIEEEDNNDIDEDPQ